MYLAKAADKRIQREDEYSDSEDEGEGGRKNEDSHKKKRRKLEGESNDGKPQGKKIRSLLSFLLQNLICAYKRKTEVALCS